MRGPFFDSTSVFEQINYTATVPPDPKVPATPQVTLLLHLKEQSFWLTDCHSDRKQQLKGSWTLKEVGGVKRLTLAVNSQDYSKMQLHVAGRGELFYDVGDKTRHGEAAIMLVEVPSKRKRDLVTFHEKAK